MKDPLQDPGGSQLLCKCLFVFGVMKSIGHGLRNLRKDFGLRIPNILWRDIRAAWMPEGLAWILRYRRQHPVGAQGCAQRVNFLPSCKVLWRSHKLSQSKKWILKCYRGSNFTFTCTWQLISPAVLLPRCQVPTSHFQAPGASINEDPAGCWGKKKNPHQNSYN